MTDTIHSCSYYCHKPECIKAQRDELRDKLYQRTWGGLTHEEIWQTVTDCTIGGDLHADKFARAIEAKLKEKNTNA